MSEWDDLAYCPSLRSLLPLTWHSFIQLSWLACRAGTGGGGVEVSDSKLLQLALEALPFEMTNGQQVALDNILGQMEGWPPMQCLLQVGRPG